ncbi:MAG TPA: hypothetical protein VLC92_06755 [Rhodocyclaceae bacterium]|nr:hypothetical protein [Rhodocyclaceae bacterium]
MTPIITFLSDYWIAITVTFVVFVGVFLLVRGVRADLSRARFDRDYDSYIIRPDGSMLSQHDEEIQIISTLISRDDVTLRILEEISDVKARAQSGSADAVRLRKLARIRYSLRKILKESVREEVFPALRDRVVFLLDEITKEADRLQSKEPFTDIQDPERSLLIDLFAEIDEEKTVVRQKALQLANIIKIKHQDILKLQSDNAKSATWTKWGTAGTVVFGILSIVLSVLTLKP